jgi:hypothetical protein
MANGTSENRSQHHEETRMATLQRGAWKRYGQNDTCPCCSLCLTLGTSLARTTEDRTRHQQVQILVRIPANHCTLMLGFGKR